MKRQDIFILLWLCLQDKKPSQKEISEKLDISRAAVSYSIDRCIGLNILDKKKISGKETGFSGVYFLRIALHISGCER